MSEENFSRNYDKSRELCFDKNEFLKESFSVDAFLREHRNKASLEIMRDDLGAHLKTLRLSMIELINKDYEDFVNLSKDLVGLDNGIRKIQIPLEEIKNEVLQVKNDLEDAIAGFKKCLEQYREITNRKRSLIHITHVITCLKKLKSILYSNKADDKMFDLSLIERATMEFNHLQFSVSKCENDLLECQKKEADDIKNKLMNVLNEKFMEYLKLKNSVALIKCLKLYEHLDKISDLESLVRYKIVAPKLSELISEQSLQKEPDGISCVYEKIINFIETELIDLFRLTTYGEKPPSVKGYNLMVNSFWPELENRLDLPLMFAPGNPKLFHSRFTKTFELVKKLEIFCGNNSAVIKLRQNKQCQNFFQKWNLMVYFKIRFQEIAGQLEKTFMEMDEETVVFIKSDGIPFYLKSSSTVLEQIKKCWRKDIYLSELSHMFWKLSLQILSRYALWLNESLKKDSKLTEEREVELTTLQTSTGADNIQIKTRLDFLVCLFSDANKLLAEIELFLETCKEKIPNGHMVEEELEISMKESILLVREILPVITNHIVKVIVSESAIHFHQVSQIPRLFRRTNRKSSTEPCEYIGQALKFPKDFQEWKKKCTSEQIFESWLTAAINELTTQFYNAVNEVLTNAQKTEESLRKLKKKKDAYPSKNSGDEEIRQQLVIDVHSFSEGVNSINVQRENVKMLNELVKLVESARHKTEKQ